MRADWHSHTDKSNLQHRDSTNFVGELIDKAIELNLKGLAITDHASLSSHIDALKHMKEIKSDKDIDFKLALGTEIYLVHRDEIENARETNEKTKYYHLVLVARNEKGYRAIAKLSSDSWEEAFHHRGVMRIPTYWDYFEKWAIENGENVIVTSACLGSEFATYITNYLETQEQRWLDKAVRLAEKMKELFKDNYYIELQPSHFDEQVNYNKLAFNIAKSLKIKPIIDTDAHYLTLDDKENHAVFLKSQNADRETEQFYSSTYVMSKDQLWEYFINRMTIVDFEWCIRNGLEICDKIEEYDLFRTTEVPNATMEFDYNRKSILSHIDFSKYQYIYKFGTSEDLIDLIFLQQIEIGIEEKGLEINDILLSRLNEEFEALWEISQDLKQNLSSYYVLTKELVEIIWQTSLVGVSRGSAGAFMVCFILGITSINPIEFNLPSWRHISKERSELPDIDIDSEAGQRANILQLIKEKYGYNKVLNIGTFKTEGTASAIQTICRGMDISTDEASYLSSLVVEGKSIKECFETMDEDKEARKLIQEMMHYDGLIENVVKIEGLCCGRSSHASGVYIFPHPYWETNAMMRTPKGLPITQYDMASSDYQGGLKLDFLTIESLDRIRKAMELMIQDKIIEDKGGLKETYDYYLHPTKIEMQDSKMFEMLEAGEVLDAFQFDSPQGRNAINKIHPNSFLEIMNGNALMRLITDGEQPIDKFVKHKKDINIWYEEMRVYGLNLSEMEVMKEHLLSSYGVATTQESVMRLSMDAKIAGFDLVWANKLRKAIAKAKAKKLFDSVKEKFYAQGESLGNRKAILDYVWEMCIEPMRGYSFSEPHIAGYSLILMQELNIASKYSLLHWKTACLNVNAGDINDDISKGTDYGAVAKAIGMMEKGFVSCPSINFSDIGFKPNMKDNKALYGLGAINGISMDLAREIIKLRPFLSFDDFLKRAVDTKIVAPTKVYNLIKGGCFDEFGNRVEIMKYYVLSKVKLNEKLTMANFPRLLKSNLIPNTYAKEANLLLLKKEIFIAENKKVELSKTKALYEIPASVLDFFEENYFDDFVDVIAYSDEGKMLICNKDFDKVSKKLIVGLTDYVKQRETLNNYNSLLLNTEWNKYCAGSVAHWEMESICYYSDIHELEEVDIDRFYNLSNFEDLPSEPAKIKKVNNRTKKEYLVNKTYVIAGVVVDKNKNKRIVTISTKTGVVDIKLSKEAYTTFDRKTDSDDSWFKRGSIILVNGYRKGENFFAKLDRDSMFTSVVMQIVNNNGVLDIKTEKGE